MRSPYFYWLKKVCDHPESGIVVTGSTDEFAPPDLVEQLFLTWNPDNAFTVINEADHFFSGLRKYWQKSYG
jgi:alpha/beta superfamily hydrolase